MLESARASKLIGASLDAKVTLYASGELRTFVESVLPMLPQVLIASVVELGAEGENGASATDIEGLTVTVVHADGPKCERCWSYSGDVGSDHDHPTLCARCAAVVNSL